MEQNSILVIGAGAAGLAAADCLCKRGSAVRLLEARERLGGRVHTIGSQPGKLPIELGAEFIHGERNATWDVVRAAKLRTNEVPERHWKAFRGKICEDPKLWDELEEIIGRFSTDGPDRDFRSLLEQAQGPSSDAKRLALDYVEGFHAADASRIGIHALARAKQTADREKGTHQFRLAEGYAALLRWFETQLHATGVELHSETVVKTIRWEPGRVEVEAQTHGRWRRFEAARALVTLPLGVLQEKGPGAVWFEPRLMAKEKAIEGLAVGSVSKVTLHFKRRFWPVENFGFIHSDDPSWPTWWSDEHGPVLTGWTGGPRARQLLKQPAPELVSHALAALSRLFKVEQNELRELLLRAYHHDWDGDPFSCGAYSYTPVGMLELPMLLAEPVADTLFFAGEATDAEGRQGTVHGALNSGWRAAEQILASFTRPVRAKSRVREHAR